MQAYLLMRIIVILIVLAEIIVLNSCSLGFKTLAGVRNPKVETKESIIKFLDKTGYGFDYVFTLKGEKDSAIIINNVTSGFGTAFLFDSLGTRYCLKSNGMCGGSIIYNTFEDVEAYFDPCSNDSLKLHHFLSKMEPLYSNLEYSLPNNHKYYLIITWSKFYKRNFNFKYLKKLKEESKADVEVIWVNADLQESWGLKKGKKMKFKIKFLGNGEGELIFKKIPYI